MLAAGIGALIGAAIGRARRQPREWIREIAENWGFLLGVLGLLLYIAELIGIIHS